MDIPVIVITVGLASLFVLFLIARRVLRLALRLALAGVLILMLVGGGVAWWWFGSDGAENRNANKRPAGAARPTPSR